MAQGVPQGNQNQFLESKYVQFVCSSICTLHILQRTRAHCHTHTYINRNRRNVYAHTEILQGDDARLDLLAMARTSILASVYT